MPESNSSQFDWTSIVDTLTFGNLVRVLFLVVIAFPALFVLSRFIGKVGKKYLSEHSGALLRKGVFYLGTFVLLVGFLRQLGFQFTGLLGAAGVVAVAIGFASQASLSNIISGLFLISEKPFAIGDIIKVGDTVGTVLSIDLLSVKVRAFDNKFIRFPNENLIKAEVANITKFPIRRLDINLSVAYKEDIAHVNEVLKSVATKNPFCLDEPEPVIIFSSFGDSGLEFLFGVWCVKTDFLKLRNSIMREIKERFDEEGIEIPFPHRTLYTGAVTDPLPIRIVSGQDVEEIDRAASQSTSPTSVD